MATLAVQSIQFQKCRRNGKILEKESWERILRKNLEKESRNDPETRSRKSGSSGANSAALPHGRISFPNQPSVVKSFINICFLLRNWPEATGTDRKRNHKNTAVPYSLFIWFIWFIGLLPAADGGWRKPIQFRCHRTPSLNRIRRLSTQWIPNTR